MTLRALFLSLLLLVTAPFSFAQTVGLYCEDNTDRDSWAMCPDSGYDRSLHRPPKTGSFTAGGMTCTNADSTGYVRCLYSSDWADFGNPFTPPPPLADEVAPTEPLLEIASDKIDFLSTPTFNGIRAFFQFSDRDPKDAIGTAVPYAPVAPTATRNLTGGNTAVAPLAAHTHNGVQYAGVQFDNSSVSNLLKQLGSLPSGGMAVDRFYSNSGYAALAGLSGSRSITVKSAGNCGSAISSLSYSSANGGGYIMNQTAISSTQPCVEVYAQHAGSGASIFRFAIQNPTFTACPAGYTEDATRPGQCTVSDADAARASQAAGNAADYNCPVTKDGPVASDPDCAAALSTGNLKTATNAAGKPVTIFENPATKTSYAVTHSKPPIFSKTQVNADGSASREDVAIPDRQPVGTPTVTHQPTSPPPAFPGALNGPGGGGSGPSGNYCGSPGQPPCKFDDSGLTTGLDGVANAVDGVKAAIEDLKGMFCGAPGQPPCAMYGGLDGLDGLGQSIDGLGDKLDENAGLDGAEIGTDAGDAESALAEKNILDDIYSSVFGFTRFQVADPGYTCDQALSTANGSESVGFLGQTLDLNLDVSSLCPLVEPRESEILALTELLWTIMAVLLFIRLTI